MWDNLPKTPDTTLPIIQINSSTSFFVFCFFFLPRLDTSDSTDSILLHMLFVNKLSTGLCWGNPDDIIRAYFSQACRSAFRAMKELLSQYYCSSSLDYLMWKVVDKTITGLLHLEQFDPLMFTLAEISIHGKRTLMCKTFFVREEQKCSQ